MRNIQGLHFNGRALVIGRIVRVAEENRIYPAIVTFLSDPGPGIVNLQVFTDDAVKPALRVEYDADRSAGTWHWPE